MVGDAEVVMGAGREVMDSNIARMQTKQALSSSQRYALEARLQQVSRSYGVCRKLGLSFANT